MKEQKWIDRIAITGATITLILVIVSSYVPFQWRFWGLDGLYYFSLPVRIMTILSIVMISTSIYYLLHLQPILNPSTFRKFAAGFVIVLTLIAIIYPAATFLRGDGQLLINHLNIGKPASFRSPLYAQLIGALFIPGRVLGISSQGIYIFIDAISIFLFSSAFVRYSRKFKSLSGKLFIVISGVFTGSLPLMFGLVEHYALLHAIIAWSIVLSMESIEKEQFPLWGLVLTLFACTFHLSGVVFLVGFIIPILKKLKSTTKWIIYFVLGGFAFLVAAIYFRQHLLPPIGLPNSDNYSLFSLKHIFDLINLDFWTIPVLITIVLPPLFSKTIQLNQTDNSEFLLALVIPALAFVFVFSPDLGMPRDADLMTLYCLPAVFFSLQFWQDNSSKISPALVAAALLAGLSTTGLQVFNQGSEKYSLARFERLLKLDPQRSAYGYEVLGMHYRAKGNLEKEEDAYRNAIKYDKNERYYLRLGQIMLEQLKFEEAIDLITKSLDVKPDYALAEGVLGKALDESGKTVDADSAFQKAIKIEPDVGVHYANYAVFLMKHSRIEEAGNTLEIGIANSEPSAQLHFVNGIYLLRINRNSEALESFQRCRIVEPGGIWAVKAIEKQSMIIVAPSIPH
ncbi:tetratricopeptide repeat protein [Calditrichota bacterium]